MGAEPLGPAENDHHGLPPAPPKTGFASQPSEHQEIPLSLNDLIVPSPQTTFFFRAQGPVPEQTPIYEGDVLVIDKAAPLRDGVLVVAVDEDVFIIARLRREGATWMLASETPGMPPLLVTDQTQIFGRITAVVHQVPVLRQEGGPL